MSMFSKEVGSKPEVRSAAAPVESALSIIATGMRITGDVETSGVLKVDGEVGNKKVYDPRSWGKLAETAMASRVVDYAKQLGSAGHALTR